MKKMTEEFMLKALRFKPWQRGDWLPRLQAHRGFWVDGARENTLASLAQAKLKNFEMVEIDVRLSQDEVPILSHDKKLSRLTGEEKFLAKMTALELSKYDFPTLADVLKTKDRPSKINIEIKNDDRRDFKLEKKIIDVIRRSKKSQDVMISSFNPFSFIPFINQLPEVPRALLIDHDAFPQLSYLRIVASLVAQPHMINWPYQLLNKALVQFLNDQGVPVAAWTVNDYRKADELTGWGVDSLITDRILPEVENKN